MKIYNSMYSTGHQVLLLFISVIFAIFTLTATAYSNRNNDDTYMKYPPGVSTYGADDGGCFFCAESALRPSISLTGTTLNEHCRKMCDADPECVSYTISRLPALPPQKYFHNNKSNCCLEKRRYTKEMFVDSNSNPNPNNVCQLDSMCWTRYEKKDEMLSKEEAKTSNADETAKVVTKLKETVPISIKAMIDTYIRDGIHISTNYGSETILPAKTASTDYTRISLIKFNIPNNIARLAHGRKAKLRLYVVLVDTDASRTVSIARMPDKYRLTEDKSVWKNTRDMMEKLGVKEGSSSLTITQDDRDTWVEVDISDLMVDGQLTLALYIDDNQVSSGNLVEFASREAGKENTPYIIFEEMTLPPTPSPSGLCKRIWDEVTYTDDEIQEKIDFIKEGCVSDDEKYRQMLEDAHDQCLDEIVSESLAISIIKGSQGLYTHVSVDW